MLQQVKANNKVSIPQIITSGFVGFTGGVAAVSMFIPTAKIGFLCLGGVVGAYITCLGEYKRQKKMQSPCKD